LNTHFVFLAQFTAGHHKIINQQQ